MDTSNKYKIISAKTSLGANIRGCELAPDVIKSLGLIRTLKQLDVDVEDGPTISDRNKPAGKSGNVNNFQNVSSFCKKLFHEVKKTYRDKQIPVILGGDHSVSTGSVLAAADRYAEINVLWLDAHGDYNTPSTSLSGNIHGMPLAAICGRYEQLAKAVSSSTKRVNPQQVILVGLRNLDLHEKERIESDRIMTIDMLDYADITFSALKHRLIKQLTTTNLPLYISLDMDVLSPYLVPGVGSPEPCGFNDRELLSLLISIKSRCKVIGFDITEVNPLTDSNNKTSKLAFDIIRYFLGKIL